MNIDFIMSGRFTQEVKRQQQIRSMHPCPICPRNQGVIMCPFCEGKSYIPNAMYNTLNAEVSEKSKNAKSEK